MSASLCTRRERETPAIHNIHVLAGTSKAVKRRKGDGKGERIRNGEKRYRAATKNEIVKMDCEM